NDGRRTDVARLLSRLERFLQRQEDGRERLSDAGALAARSPLDPRSSHRKGGEAAGPRERDASAPSGDDRTGRAQHGRPPGSWRHPPPARALLDSRERSGPAPAAIRCLIFWVTRALRVFLGK